MFNKLTLSALGLMAAVTGPMVFFAVSKPAVSLPTGPVQATPDRSLTEVFQFNITPEWIMRRWPQVATGLDQVQLQGYRVPLISGTAESDVAGALTYYFNAQQQLQRITFLGNTGDPRKLIVLLRSRYQLTWRPTNDPARVVYEAVRSDNRPASALRIVTAPVMNAAEPGQRFELQLVLERPEE
ncbi:MAG: DUF6690 family protein [Thermoguttaceae bacterium]